MNTEELKKKIANAEKELAEMRELLEEKDWEPKDIVPGTMYNGPGISKSVILQVRYARLSETKRYGGGGYNDNPLRLYSNYGHDGITDVEYARRLNDQRCVKLGMITTNF